MGTPQFTPEFKEEAVHQMTERCYSAADAYYHAWRSLNNIHVDH
jgi:hypothetical protein